MMETTNPATLAACGARKTDLLAGSITSEIIPPAFVFQARRIARQFRLSPELACAIAELAFASGRAA